VTRRGILLFLSAALATACGGRSDLATSLSPGQERDCGAPWLLFTWIPVSAPDTSGSRIYAERADGTEGHVLALPHPDAAYPSATPDGTGLLYADASLDQLYLYDFAGKTERQLATMGVVGFGSVSPDGQTVVYGDGNDLFVVGVDGPPDDVTLVPGYDLPTGAAGYPVFLPDSQTVVFGAGGEVESIRIDGSGMTTLLSDEAIETFPNPALSPDREELAAVVSCDGVTYEVRTYPLASLPAPCETGKVATEVSGSPVYYDLAWGPTGLIAYSGGVEVFVVSASGGAPADFSGVMTEADEPTWVSGCVALP
jgi:Tol biopolymer transport system component